MVSAFKSYEDVLRVESLGDTTVLRINMVGWMVLH